MTSYYQVRLGEGGKHSRECVSGGFIGTDFLIHEDLAGKLPEDWRQFNHVFIPKWLARNPGKGKISAGLACGALWTVSRGILEGDVVLCPDGPGTYRVGEVCGPYSYAAGGVLPHRRPVRWYSRTVQRGDMSDALQRSVRSIGTVANITTHAEELRKLIGGDAPPTIVSLDETVEDPALFAMERHLEDFLVQNWKQTELGGEYDVYEEDGELVGQQYPTDSGPVDILAVSKDRKRLLVIELKKGRANDVVVGQILRYMGYVQSELAEDGQVVVGAIIALEDDQRIRRALAIVPSVSFYRYQISFKLVRT